jgi:hypothetical protein
MLFTGRVAPMHLFGLAPDGVCLAALVTKDAGTLLPHLFTLTAPEGTAIRSLLHSSVTLQCLAVSQHRYPMEGGLSSAKSPRFPGLPSPTIIPQPQPKLYPYNFMNPCICRGGIFPVPYLQNLFL